MPDSAQIPADIKVTHYQGDTFIRTVTLTDQDSNPINVSGATVKMEIRKVGCGDILETLDNSDGVTIGGTGNNVITLDKNINIEAGVHAYDLQVTKASVVTTYIAGDFKVIKDVTE